MPPSSLVVSDDAIQFVTGNPTDVVPMLRVGTFRVSVHCSQHCRNDSVTPQTSGMGVAIVL